MTDRIIEHSGAANCTRDLFEDLAAMLGCTYISDLKEPKYLNIARICLTAPCVAGYPVAVWKDMLNYLSVCMPQENLKDENEAKQLLLREIVFEGSNCK